jgi:phage tail-like protein
MNRAAAPSRLLPVPAPPHDPYSLMLAGHIGSAPEVGWRLARSERLDIDPLTRALRLSPAPAASRWLSEASGSFGGLRPPANVAVTARGDVLLLDGATGELRRFDPCCCRFLRLPCVARLAEPRAGCEALSMAVAQAAPRDRLLDPQGIAACGDELFIADRGHHRIVRYALGTWIPRGTIRLPAAQRQALGGQEWHPTGLVFDGAGRLIVTDPVNGRLDRFKASGRWIDMVAVERAPTHVAVDCRDRVLVVIEKAFVHAVAALPAVDTLECDGQSDGFQWHTLQLAPLAGAARFAVDVHAGDEPWTPVELNDPLNPRWARWIGPDGVRQAIVPLSLGGRAGRFLRLRFSPAPGHASAPFDATVRGARVLRVSGGTSEVLRNARANLVDGFGRPPLVVDSRGRLHLPCESGVRVFDGRGEPVTCEPDASGDRFERSGDYVSAALDSRIDGCEWHRVELRGAVPPGCSIDVRTLSSAIELTPAEIELLPDTAWTRVAAADAMQPVDRRIPGVCAWDVLVGSQPGRYLWLRLTLRGDGRETPCVSGAIVEYPRISLRRYLPGVFGIDPAGADFTDRFTAIFDRTLRSLETRLDELALYFDPLSAPAEAGPGEKDFLSWLGEWIGISLAREWPVDRRRRYLKEAARLYCQRGTPDGLRRQLLLLLGFDRAYAEHCLAERPRCRCVPRPLNCGPCPVCAPAAPPPLILEHFKLRRWLYAGHGRLGSDSELWGKRIVGRSELSGGTADPPNGNAQLGVTSLNTVPDPLRDPFHVHAHRFSVFVPARIRDCASERRALEQLLAREAPAHAQVDIRYVEPRFRVGVQATIGLDSAIARTPAGVTLDRSMLRQGTVLTGRPYGPHLEVGESRVGTTTRLS